MTDKETPKVRRIDDRLNIVHRRGDPDIVHTDPPGSCACRSAARPPSADERTYQP